MILRAIGMAVFAALLTITPVSAESGDPMATIKGPIDKVITILNDPQYATQEARDTQRNQIWKAVKPMFDFNEVSARSVARYWKSFSPEEKKEFSDVFANFLGNIYIDKIQGEYHNEKIVYLEQEILQEKYAEVRTQIVRETIETPVYYRMLKGADGSWKVYDIYVEGVSLLKNYRIQFAGRLKKETPAQLIDYLKQKLDEQNGHLSTDG